MQSNATRMDKKRKMQRDKPKQEDKASRKKRNNMRNIKRFISDEL